MRFKAYLKVKQLPDIDDIDDNELPAILTTFYTDVRTKGRGELYKTSSFKVLRVGLNSHFKLKKNIDIVSDNRFMRANLSIWQRSSESKEKWQGGDRLNNPYNTRRFTTHSWILLNWPRNKPTAKDIATVRVVLHHVFLLSKRPRELKNYDKRHI